MRILAVIPGSEKAFAFVFSRRQMAAVAVHGHIVEVFDLRERRGPLNLLRNLRLYRRRLREFRPDVVHAHYGAIGRGRGTKFWPWRTTSEPL